MLVLLLLMAAFICFVIDAWLRKSIQSVGLACWVLAVILTSHPL